MTLFQNIILKLAKRFGLQLQTKQSALDDYSLTLDEQGIPELSLTPVISRKLAVIAMQDSGVTIEGKSARARYMQEFLDYYLGDRMDTAAEVALGTGDCLIKPYTDGRRLGVDIIKNGDFAVCESIGNEIRSCVMKVGEFRESRGPAYERFEIQMLRQGEAASGKTVDVLMIRNLAFKNGKEVPLTEVPAWAGIQEEEIIPNVHKPLFGRYKSPAVNRANINGVDGVKVTYGLDGAMAQAMEAYDRFNREYRSGEKLVFLHKTLLAADDQGNPVFPEGKRKLFLLMKQIGDKGSLIQEYTPDLRSADLEKGLEVNLRMVELLMGVSPGILTRPATSYATATEMRAALNDTYALITRFRRQLERGTNDLLEAVDIIANRNQLAPIGPWSVQYDWSSAYIEQMNEHFSQMMLAEGIGAVDRAEVRGWLMNEDYETAKARIEQIAEESGSDYLEEAPTPA